MHAIVRPSCSHFTIVYWWPAWKVETLELLRALVPDTLRAKALNGATPAHDAAFQGRKKGEILEIAAIKKRMLCIWDFVLVVLICVSWEWGFKISEMLKILKATQGTYPTTFDLYVPGMFVQNCENPRAPCHFGAPSWLCTKHIVGDITCR